MVALPAPQLAELLDLDAIRAKKAQNRLRHFVKQAWHVVEPATPYLHNWHIEALSDHLEATLNGEIRNLLVTMPPRAMKSLTISVFFPAWVWIHRPELRFLYASYAQSLATEHSQSTRRVIESDWYQTWWSDRFELSDDDNLKTRFSNDHRGARIATSVGAAVTGFGGDLVIADDPHNVQQRESEAVREATIDWWNKAMSTRLNNPKTGVKIVVMQRVHQHDVAGSCIDSGDYVHLNLPMEYEPSTFISPLGWVDPRKQSGDLMWPERVDRSKVEEQKRTLGSLDYAAQYQQRPAPREGGMFKRSWWRRYDALPDFTTLEVHCDSAFKEGVENDYSVFSLWGKTSDESAYLINVWRGRLAFPDLIRQGHEAMQWAKAAFPGKAITLVVEDKASGQSAIQTWKRPFYTATGALPSLSVVAFKIEGTQSKVARAEGVTALVEGGRAFIPNEAPWLDDWLAEHQMFPTGAHDDQVDTTSMALTRLLLKKSSSAWGTSKWRS